MNDLQPSVHASTRAAGRRGSADKSKMTRRKSAQKLTESLLVEYNQARAQAIPLSQAANWDSFLRYFRCGDPHHDPTRKSTAKVSLWTLLSYSTATERWLMVLGLVMATVTGLGIPTWLFLLARSLDTFSNLAILIDKIGGDGLMTYLRQELNRLCLAFVLVGVLALVSGTVYVSLWTYTGEKQALRIQKSFVRASLNQDAEWFDGHDREALPTEMGTALVHINNAIGRQVADVYANAVSALGCLVVAIVLNAALSLVMLCVVPLAIVIMTLFNYFVRRLKRRANKELAHAGGMATEVLAGIKTVVSLCAQSHFLERYCHHVDQSAKYSVYSATLSSLLMGITSAMFYVTYTVAFYIGTEQVVSGARLITIIKCFFSDDPQCRITGAAVMCSIYGVILCVTFFGLMGPGIATVNLGRSSAVQVFDTLRRKPKMDPSDFKSGKRLGDIRGKIEFKDVFFYYGTKPTRPIFYNFDLTIEAGQSVALVGPSGSGKSTIAKFLLRFYDPTQGQIMIDDKHPLTSLNVSWWRSKIGYVAQEPILFPGTIRDNIALGKPSANYDKCATGDEEVGEATNDEIIQAAKMACAHEFILDLPDGYNTYYGGTSIQLSGGQMQRIAIARALLRQPRILVLDEATSALDSKSERHVQEALRNIRQRFQITTVTIAHRLSTILDCDKIAVISNGKIAEIGAHDTLMSKPDGIYRLLCESQGITSSTTSNTAHDNDGNNITNNNSLMTTPQDVVVRSESSLAEEEFGDGTRSLVVRKNVSTLTTDESVVAAVELPSSPSGHVEMGLRLPRPRTIASTISKEPISEEPMSEEPLQMLPSLSGTKSFPIKEVALDHSAIGPIDENPTFESQYTQEEEPLVEVETASTFKIWRYVGKDAIFSLIGLVGSGILGALSPCESILTARIVNTFYTVPADDMIEENVPIISSFLYFALASLLGNLMVGIGLSRSGSHLGAKLRKLTFGAMLRRSMGWFDDPEHTTGELTTVLGADVEAVEGLTGPPMGFRVRMLTSIITGVSIALAYSAKIGLVAIGCVPFILIAGLVQVVCLRKQFVAVTDGPTPPTIMEQGLRGISSVQAYGLENKVGDDYERALQPESEGKVKRGAIAGLVFGFSQMAIFVSFAIVFYVGSNLLVSVDIHFEEFFTSVLAVMFGAIGASQVSADFNSRQGAKIAAARIFHAMEEGPADGDEGEQKVTLLGEISLDSCEFSYPARPDHPIFYKSDVNPTGLNLNISQKQCIGFVGRSGSGKSTVLQIVLRFYPITRGSVKLDDHDIADIHVDHLRSQIGYVGQLPTLFHGTVRQNILLGNPHASQQEIELAAKSAHAHDFITDLPDAYDTDVGPGGNLLSGGQKQRIAIARAIVRDPAMLVLDEATAALDNESQKMVQAALDELQSTRPRTTLVVAHRLLTIKNCDKIVFLGEGGVLEMGTHDELMEKKEEYYKLWMMQGSDEEQHS